MAAELVVVCEEGGDRGEASDLTERFGADGHGAAEGEIDHAEEACYQDAGGELGGDSESFDAGGEGFGGGAVEGGDEPDFRVGEWGGDLVEVVAVDFDVAVVDDEDGVAGAAGEL